MNSDWLLLEELFEQGDPAFVTRLREHLDADRLGSFAAKWFNDRRREARRLLFEYLDLPLNAPRHEALVKRLFKLAEKAGDDEVMGRFVVLFDRSVRRVCRRRYHYDWRTRQRWHEDKLRVPPDTTIPRNLGKAGHPRTGERIPIKGSAGDGSAAHRFANRRLFSVHTRNYLRRRAWRYFRQLGKDNPDRYVKAAVSFLKCYTDEDTLDGLALLDNWGLMHVLFHHSPIIVARPHGWFVAEDRRLADLAPAPIYAEAWRKAPELLIELLKKARCRPVRLWALKLIEQDHSGFLSRLPIHELIALLSHEDSEVATAAAEALHSASGLDQLSVADWLKLLKTSKPETLDLLCELLTRHLDPGSLTFEQAVPLACSRPLPVARLGLQFLRSKSPRSDHECALLLSLTEAEADAVRPELVKWARQALSQAPGFQANWVLEYLDSRHEDVRREGWSWFMEEPRARNDVDIWKKLLESPYDDVRIRLVVHLEKQGTKRRGDWLENGPLDGELICFLWSAVLLNVHRGNRCKPGVVGQIVRRLSRRAEEARLLLPILAAGLRSLRGPEWRAALAGVVQLLEQVPHLEAEIRAVFPELNLATESAAESK
ncbi:MAG: hypothetical protein KatS3mg105_0746 [Gemmatales bacterium]|nr:MAG: hypothetical protein KatS3mg105_0746 [Gemmatales bacterium]